MIILSDSRERQNAHILKAFDAAGVKHLTNKLPVGDYMNLHKPQIIVERKSGLEEVYSNVTTEHQRFINELKRAAYLEVKLLILVETPPDEFFLDIDFVPLWKNPRAGKVKGAFSGERLYKIMQTIADRYGVEWLFIPKPAAGKEIMNLLA